MFYVVFRILLLAVSCSGSITSVGEEGDPRHFSNTFQPHGSHNVTHLVLHMRNPKAQISCATAHCVWVCVCVCVYVCVCVCVDNDASDKIWLRSARWSCLKLFTDARTDGRTPARPLCYKLSSEPSAQVS